MERTLYFLFGIGREICWTDLVELRNIIEEVSSAYGMCNFAIDLTSDACKKYKY